MKQALSPSVNIAVNGIGKVRDPPGKSVQAYSGRKTRGEFIGTKALANTDLRLRGFPI